jgi:GNAT superfamily N-acetyltransferase
MHTEPCPFCGSTIEGADLDAFGRAGLAHVRSEHRDVPYPDMAVRNYFEGMARMTGGTERLESIGAVEVHPVTEDRIDDWLDYFDHHAMTAIPQYAACYCLEPHALEPGAESMPEAHWSDRRAAMIERLRQGTTFGYLAYVDGQPAGWVNASLRCHYSLYRRGDEADDQTIGVSCFAVAPPFQFHGVAKALLDRVLADAPERGVTAVEAYPFNADTERDVDFRGTRSMFDRAGFTEVKIRTRDTVVRRPVVAPPETA